MGLRYENLTEATRRLMKEEVVSDVGRGVIYLSNYLTDQGRNRWPVLLEETMSEGGNDDTLAAALMHHQCFKLKKERRKPKGGFTIVAVPVTAAQTLAESQFNMYYMRALARQAIESMLSLMVYRAKEVGIPRRESELMIGSSLDPAEVLTVLRETRGVEPSINIPMPNTGLTVRLV